MLIVLGDTIFQADFSKLFRFKSNVLGVKEVDDPGADGNLIAFDAIRVTVPVKLFMMVANKWQNIFDDGQV